MAKRARILYAYGTEPTFIRIDRDALLERFDVESWHQRNRFFFHPRLVRSVLRADAVVGWWASWPTFWPIVLAWLFRRPTLLIVGGFDVANMPEIGYGLQQGGIGRFISRFLMRRATHLMTNSNYSVEEIEQNVGIGREKVRVVHHGIPDEFGEPREGERERMALCVGFVTQANLAIKGQRAFVRAAAHLPDVRFVLAGPWKDDAIDSLRAEASDNVEFTGWVEDEELLELFRAAAVYVQPSHHEGFGMAVAEAMLAGCVPVTTRAGALPEVVGDAGILVDSEEPADVADGVRRALELPPEAGRRARERVLREFPLEMRREGLTAAVEEVLR